MSEPIKKDTAQEKLAAIKAKLVQSKARLAKFKAVSDANNAMQNPAQSDEKSEKKSPPPSPFEKRLEAEEPIQDSIEKEPLNEGNVIPLNAGPWEEPPQDTPAELHDAQTEDHDSLFDTPEPVVQEPGEVDDSLFNVHAPEPVSTGDFPQLVDPVQDDDQPVDPPEVVTSNGSLAQAKKDALGAFAFSDPVKAAKTLNVLPLPKPKKSFKEILEKVYDFLENNLEKVFGPVAGAVISGVAALFGAGAIAVVPLLIGSAYSAYNIYQDKPKGETQ